VSRSALLCTWDPGRVPHPREGLRRAKLAFAHAAVLLLGIACKPKDPAITEPFVDDFERGDVGPSWYDTGAGYKVSGGKLAISKAYNHPLWLRKRLPPDLVLDVDVMSMSTDGDIKVELYGDGRSFDPDKGNYDPTGYVLFFGGHQNTESVISRLGEHGDAVKARNTDVRVTPGRVYHWTITRKDGKIDWVIDGKPFLSWTDAAPLGGSGHEYFGVNDWETEVSFDNLRIHPAH